MKRLARWCRRYSPLVGIVESDVPDTLALDVTGCAHLFGGEVRMVRTLVDDVRRLGWSTRAVLADTVGAGWGLAHFGRAAASRAESLVIPPGAQLDALRPLPAAALRLPGEICALLDDLGLYTVGHLQELPRAALPSRFGPEILRRLDQAAGAVPELIVPERHEEPLEVRWGTEFPLNDLAIVERVLDWLLKELLRELERRHRGVLELRIELKGVGRDPVSYVLRVLRATLDCKELMELARLQWERLRPPPGVVSMKVAVSVASALECGQLDLLDNGFHRDARREREALLNRLSSRLGRDHVLQARLCPDDEPERALRFRPAVERNNPEKNHARKNRRAKRNQAGTPHEKSDNGLRRPGERDRYRPLELFPRPVPVRVWSVVPNGPPMQVRWRGSDCRIVQAEGPERIKTGWWRSPAAARDYYRITTEPGDRLWLFRSLDGGTWHVHGEF